MESAENKGLKRHVLVGDYVFDAREGRQVRRDEVLPRIGKERLEFLAFIEGVDWVLEHLVGYRSNIPNVRVAALEYAKEIYPRHE